MASPGELAQLIEHTVRAVLAGMQGAPPAPANGTPGGHNLRTLEAKGVSRVDASQAKTISGRNGHFNLEWP